MEFSTHNRQIMPLIISGISIQSGADGFRFIFRRVRPRMRILLVCPVSLCNSIEFIEGQRGGNLPGIGAAMPEKVAELKYCDKQLLLDR